MRPREDNKALRGNEALKEAHSAAGTNQVTPIPSRFPGKRLNKEKSGGNRSKATAVYTPCLWFIYEVLGLILYRRARL